MLPWYYKWRIILRPICLLLGHEWEEGIITRYCEFCDKLEAK